MAWKNWPYWLKWGVGLATIIGLLEIVMWLGVFAFDLSIDSISIVTYPAVIPYLIVIFGNFLIAIIISKITGSTNEADLFIFINTNAECAYDWCPPLPNHLGLALTFLIMIISLFIIGAIIGLIIGKIKSYKSKKLKTQITKINHASQ